MAKYGITWWGNKWLEIFNNITWSNRLPRGRAYASNGAVNNIEIGLGFALASVQGSRRKPYKVETIFSILNEKNKSKIIDYINNSPSILVKLINHELPTTLFDFLRKNDIKFFPAAWDDVKAKCSCPDYAMPCKHIASLVYIVANIIDKDPFVLFKLFGIDLIKELDCLESKKTIQSIRKIEELLPDYAFKNNEDNANTNNIYTLEGLKEIPDLLSQHREILKDKPIFWEVKNFKTTLEDVYLFWRKYAKNELEYANDKQPNIKSWEKAKLFKEISLIINNKNECIEIKIDDKIDNKLNKSLLDFLNQIPLSEINQYCNSIQFLFFLNKLIILIIQKSAIIPEILSNINDEAFIRWIPAFFKEEVLFNIKILEKNCPSKIVLLKSAHGIDHIKEDQLLKTIFSVLINYHLNENLPTKTLKYKNDKIFGLFFCNKKIKFNTIEDKNIPSLINLWLSNFYLTENLNNIYLFVKEKDDNFLLDLQIKINEEFKNIYTYFNTITQSKKIGILSKIRVLLDYIPELEDVFVNKYVIFNLKKFNDIFFNKIPVMQSLGVKVVLPKALKNVLIPKIKLNISTKTKNEITILNINDLLNFDWKIAIGNKQYSLLEFKKISKTASGLVKIKEEYVVLNPEEIKKVVKQMETLPHSTLKNEELMQVCIGENIKGIEAVITDDIKGFLKNLMNAKPVDPPLNLNAKLRPYQIKGMQWLIQNINVGFGSILADDMGLGKTLQVIATILYYKNSNINLAHKYIIICPTGLINNWQNEISKFAPELKIKVYHGLKRTLNDFKEEDILITSYGTARSDKSMINKHNWFLCVIDEAQNIKNPDSQVSKSIKSVVSSHKIALSGTPVENRLLEYWSIFDFANKNYLGNKASFIKNFAMPIERESNQASLDLFHKITKPFILRRLKNDKSIIKDLPNKIENNIYCSLTAEQTALYNEIVKLNLKKIETGEDRNSAIFNLLISLKQVCNHPSQYTKHIDANIAQSGKLQLLKNHLNTILQNNEKVIIFTQFIKTGEIIADIFEKEFGIKIPFLNGSVPINQRDIMINDFQNSSQTKIIIISLKAGGTGLNLTAANNVIHFDLWWNPAVETQATDRAYRIGQQKNVFVYRFITSGTLEERIDKIIESKKELANLTVTSGESWITKLSNEEIIDLIKL